MNALTALALIFVLLTSVDALADLTFSAPPREDNSDAKLVYGLLADQLSKVLGVPVHYQQPDNWNDYATNMRTGQYDIVFDGPHFVAWRIKHIDHRPVVRLPGFLQFIVIAKKSDTDLKGMHNLLGNGLCGLASPNLGTLAAFNLYNNPIVQPEIQNINGGPEQLMEAFLNGKCRAVVIPDLAYQKLGASKKEGIKILATSRKMPNQTISVTGKIDPEKRDKIEKFLLSKAGLLAATPLLQRFSKNDQRLIPAPKNEYEGLEELLEGVVYGW